MSPAPPARAGPLPLSRPYGLAIPRPTPSHSSPLSPPSAQARSRSPLPKPSSRSPPSISLQNRAHVPLLLLGGPHAQSSLPPSEPDSSSLSFGNPRGRSRFLGDFCRGAHDEMPYKKEGTSTTSGFRIYAATLALVCPALATDLVGRSRDAQNHPCRSSLLHRRVSPAAELRIEVAMPQSSLCLSLSLSVSLTPSPLAYRKPPSASESPTSLPSYLRLRKVHILFLPVSSLCQTEAGSTHPCSSDELHTPPALEPRHRLTVSQWISPQ